MDLLKNTKFLLIAGILLFMGGVYTQAFEWLGGFFGLDLSESEKTIKVVSVISKALGTLLFVGGVYLVTQQKKRESES